jgi:hypothetical protein
MKKILLLSMILCLFTACQSRSETIQVIPLSEGEQQIADLNNASICYFELSNPGTYDVMLRCFENGIEKNDAIIMRTIEVPDKKSTKVMISESTIIENNIRWGVFADSTTSEFSSKDIAGTKIDDNASYFSGSITLDLPLKKNQETVLTFLLFDKQASIATEIMSDIMEIHDFNKKQDLLAGFDTAYVVTIKQVK